MKPGPNKKRDNPKVDANVAPEDNGAPGHKPISLDEVQEHIEQLRGIGTVTARLFALLGEQITAVSSTAPVQRGRKTVEELKNQANAHRDGLKQAFDPLREQIERLKNNFWEKNGDVIEATAKKYVERKVKERVLVEVEKAIERYRDHIEKNEQRNQKLRDVVHASRARTRNSILRLKYLDERVTWVGGEDPIISFGELVSADGSYLASLAESLDLSPGGEDALVMTLNKIFCLLGIRYRAIPSRTGILLIPDMTNLG